MRSSWFIILEARDAWWVENEGKEYGPFASKELAGAEALTIVRVFGDKTRRSRLYWPDENGQQILIWEDPMGGSDAAHSPASPML